jgi:hypothetical protein
MFTESQNLAIVRTELDTVFYQQFAYDGTDPGIATARSGQIFKPVSIDNLQYIGEINSDVGLWPKIGEVQVVPTATPKVTNKWTVQVADFANSIELSKNLFDDNMHGVWSNDVSKFARKATITQDQNAFNLFKNSFTTQLTADGVSLINAAHPLIQGGTTSNVVTGALTSTTLNNGIVKLRTQVDQNNVIQGGVPSILLVPSELFKTAIEVTESALVSDSANNALNIYRSAYGMQVMTTPYLSAAAGGSATAWWLLTRDHSVIRVIRQGIETALRDWRYSNNRTYLYQGNFREEVYAPDYAGIVGSTG